jgi:hypothetical protein
MGRRTAGAFFGYFAATMAWRVDLRLQVDIYEPRDFTGPARPAATCAAILYEGLVQKLAAEGIALPPGIVQGGIDACTAHGRGQLPSRRRPEKRTGRLPRRRPRGSAAPTGQSLDGYLLARPRSWAPISCPRASRPSSVPGGWQVQTRRFGVQRYDSLAVAAGVNISALKLFPAVVPGQRPPATLQLRACEYRPAPKPSSATWQRVSRLPARPARAGLRRHHSEGRVRRSHMLGRGSALRCSTRS